MLKVKVTRNGSILKITENSNYQLVAITGLNPFVADIALSQYAIGDGGVFNSARGQSRNIVMTIQPLGNIEARRLSLFRYLAPKSAITLNIETENRHVTIDGYVESMEIDYNSNPQLIQVSVICPNPYFYDIAQNSVAVPGTVNNPSEAVQGAEFIVTITGTGSSLVLTNTTTGEALTINDTFEGGELLKIVTIQGMKDVITRGVSRMSFVDLSSDWPQLLPGNNVITITGVPCTAVCNFNPLYMGV